MGVGHHVGKAHPSYLWGLVKNTNGGPHTMSKYFKV